MSQDFPTICSEFKRILLFENSSNSLSSQGSSSEAFYNVFLILLDRVFGEETTGSCSTSVSWNSSAKAGWLKEICGTGSDALVNENKAVHKDSSKMLNSNLPSELLYLQKCYDLKFIAVYLVDLFKPQGNLFSVLMQLRREYEVKIDLLPRKMQMRLTRQLEYSFVQTPLHGSGDALVRLQSISRGRTAQVSI